MGCVNLSRGWSALFDKFNDIVMGIISRVLQDVCFQAHPPVFMDVGASGPPPPLWQEIAKYSICIAFDADARDFETEGAQGWKKRLAFQRIATIDGQETDFYLTQFPHCSSTLVPDLFIGM